jgi:hypothetical protein
MTTLTQQLDEVESLPDERVEALVIDLCDPMNFVSTENKAAAYLVQAMQAQEYPPRDILRLWFQFQHQIPTGGIGGF